MMIAALAAFPLWVLLVGVRSVRRLTAAGASGLRWAFVVEIACALLLCAASVLAWQAAERSAVRGGGLPGAFGFVPLALGLLVGGLALVSGCALRAVTRTRPKSTE